MGRKINLLTAISRKKFSRRNGCKQKKGGIEVIKIVAKNVIKADKTEEYIALAKNLVQETVQNDAGCIRYELFQDLSNPQILTMIEEWEDQDALDRHTAAKHFQEIVPRFKDFVEKSSEINIYQKLA
jgi:quinol monooxygenase YgiN